MSARSSAPGTSRHRGGKASPGSPDSNGASRDQASRGRYSQALALHSEPGLGQPLSPRQRAYFEPLFGTSFGDVRVHDDADAARATDGLRARAYTSGSDIVWGRGEPRPDGVAARRLLGHELAHVVQQRRGGTRAGTKAVEADANEAASRTERGLGADVRQAADPGVPLLQSHDEEQGRPVPTLGSVLPESNRQLSSTEWTLSGFATDSAELTEAHEGVIQRIAADLNANGLGFHGWVTVWGYADSRGSVEHNQALGQSRADRVRARLVELLTDPEMGSEVRARSVGETLNTQEGDVAAYRQVTVSITRGTYRLETPGLAPAPSAPAEPFNPADLFRPILPPSLPPPDPSALPGDFWTLPSPRPASPDLLRDLSRWATGALGREQIAGVAARIAEGLGMNERDVRRQLNDAFIDGGVDGLKAALRALIYGLVGAPTTAPDSPFGPPVYELPLPPMLQSPEIRF